jgi:hypothetical protein
MCRWALISWPIGQKTPQDLYLNLGEIYDKNIKSDIFTLSQFNRDLRYLYPFRYSQKNNRCSNSEDFICLQKKYGLTVRLQLVGESDRKIITFRSPVLYDITCMVPLFVQDNCKTFYKQKNDLICIVLPYQDPISRGKLLEECVKYGPSSFVLIGDTYGENGDSTATLMCRYLLSCNVPANRILKIHQDNIPECILEALEIVDFTEGDSEYDLVIACRHENIQKIARTIRWWRKNNIIGKRVTYICPFK